MNRPAALAAFFMLGVVIGWALFGALLPGGGL